MYCNQVKIPLVDNNYAGMDVRKSADHPFPDRVTEFRFEGTKSKHYICEDCANRINIDCEVHGRIHGKFEKESAPVCKKCAKEYRLLRKGELPSGFKSLLFLSKISCQNKTIENKGFACIYNNKKIYLSDGDQTIYYGSDRKVTPEIVEENNSIILKLSLPSNKYPSCYLDLNDEELVNQCEGNWLDLWSGILLTEKMLITTAIHHLSISKVQLNSFSRKNSDCVSITSNAAICIFSDTGLHFLPSFDHPAMANLQSWSKSTYGDSSEEYILNYKTEGLPQQLIIKPYPYKPSSKCRDRIETPLSRLPGLKKSTKSNIQFHKHVKAIKYPEKKEAEYLIERNNDSFITEDLETCEKKTYTAGFPLKDRWLIIDESLENYLLFRIDTANPDFFSAIEKPVRLKNTNGILSGVFMGADTDRAVKVDVHEQGLVYDGNYPVDFQKIIEITTRRENKIISEIKIVFEITGKKLALRLLGPTELVQDFYRILEINRAKATSMHMDLPELYQKYNSLKKQNLLVGIFTDIFLLQRELDMDISMSDLEEKLQSMSNEKFFKDKDIYEKTTKKLLLLSHTLPKIKQNFHYLATFYPYYQLKNEIKLIKEVFGATASQNIKNLERKHVVKFSRANIRNMQSNLQHLLAEIEKIIFPANQIFARDEIKSTLKSKIRNNLPTAAQAALVGTAAVFGLAGGGIGVLAAMIGIRELGNVLMKIQNDEQSAAQIKKTAEEVLSWWRVFLDTLPVAICEVGDLLEDENNRCMIRDKEIFDQLAASNSNDIKTNLKNALRNRIEEGTKNRFIEVLKGERITFDTLAQDIDSSINFEIPHKIAFGSNKQPAYLLDN
jgi:hypothetical protein